MIDRSCQSEKFLSAPEIHVQWESDYLNPDMDRYYDLVFERILKTLSGSPSQTLLDAGCGYGYHTLRLARGGFRITAVDFSDAALAAARRTVSSAGRNDQVTLEKADLTRLPYEDASFNSVVSWGVIMHIPEMEKALSELARVLRPGGILVFSENNCRSIDYRVREKFIRLAKRMLGRNPPDHNVTPRGVEIWSPGDSGGLLVRKTDLDFVRAFYAALGIREVDRFAGQFTELHTNIPWRPLKRLIYAFNVFFFMYVNVPQIAASNILLFKKVDT